MQVFLHVHRSLLRCLDILLVEHFLPHVVGPSFAGHPRRCDHDAHYVEPFLYDHHAVGAAIRVFFFEHICLGLAVPNQCQHFLQLDNERAYELGPLLSLPRLRWQIFE